MFFSVKTGRDGNKWFTYLDSAYLKTSESIKKPEAYFQKYFFADLCNELGTTSLKKKLKKL